MIFANPVFAAARAQLVGAWLRPGDCMLFVGVGISCRACAARSVASSAGSMRFFCSVVSWSWSRSWGCAVACGSTPPIVHCASLSAHMPHRSWLYVGPFERRVYWFSWEDVHVCQRTTLMARISLCLRRASLCVHVRLSRINTAAFLCSMPFCLRLCYTFFLPEPSRCRSHFLVVCFWGFPFSFPRSVDGWQASPEQTVRKSLNIPSIVEHVQKVKAAAPQNLDYGVDYYRELLSFCFVSVVCHPAVHRMCQSAQFCGPRDGRQQQRYDSNKHIVG